MNKLLSRKLGLSVFAMLLITISEAAGVEMREVAMACIAGIASAYVVGQGIADRG